MKTRKGRFTTLRAHAFFWVATMIIAVLSLTFPSTGRGWESLSEKRPGMPHEALTKLNGRLKDLEAAREFYQSILDQERNGEALLAKVRGTVVVIRKTDFMKSVDTEVALGRITLQDANQLIREFFHRSKLASEEAALDLKVVREEILAAKRKMGNTEKVSRESNFFHADRETAHDHSSRCTAPRTIQDVMEDLGFVSRDNEGALWTKGEEKTIGGTYTRVLIIPYGNKEKALSTFKHKKNNFIASYFGKEEFSIGLDENTVIGTHEFGHSGKAHLAAEGSEPVSGDAEGIFTCGDLLVHPYHAVYGSQYMQQSPAPVEIKKKVRKEADQLAQKARPVVRDLIPKLAKGLCELCRNPWDCITFSAK